MLALVVVTPLREPGPLSARPASYRLTVKLDPSAHAIAGQGSWRWRNLAGAATNELYLHLYLNAFRNSATRLLGTGEHGLGGRTDHPATWGSIEIDRLRCGGQLVRPVLVGDGTVARVALLAPVAPGAELECEVAWHATLPELVARSGYRGDFYMVTQWFPKLGVWDGGSWRCHEYCASCEFYADFGTYDVAITAPANFVVGATGALVADHAGAGEHTWEYRAEDVHDFAFAASPGFVERRAELDGGGGLAPVAVRLLVQPEHVWFADEQMRLLGETLAFYGRWFGRYPYATLTAIDAPDDAGAAAMEYPTLVAIQSPSSRLAPATYARYVTIHELGHNWFYGVLASDEAREPWLDEGLNEYASELVLAETTPKGLLNLLPDTQALERLGWLALGPGWTALGEPAWGFPSQRSYEAVAYGYATSLLGSLERKYGRDHLLASLGLYARRYRFRHPTARGLMEALSEGLGDDVTPLITQALEGRELELEVSSIAPGKRAVLHRAGGMRIAVPVRLRFADGHEQTVTWDPVTRWQVVPLPARPALRDVVIDPAGAWLIDRDRLTMGLAARPQRKPARRSTAGLAFLLQSAWQLLGF
jgi:hypothetical protein